MTVLPAEGMQRIHDGGSGGGGGVRCCGGG